jgi:hypothetical protein
MSGGLTKRILGMLIGVAFVPTASVADCRGFVCGLVQGIPVIGPAAHDVDQGIAGIKDRVSDADVLHQVTGLGAWNNPVGRPASFPPPPPGAASSNAGIVNFSIQDSARYLVHLKFFSQDRDHYWPAVDQNWEISDGAPHQYSLSCKVGEKICYGAASSFSGGSYWGVGLQGNEGCQNCCLTCGSPQENVTYS